MRGYIAVPGSDLELAAEAVEQFGLEGAVEEFVYDLPEGRQAHYRLALARWMRGQVPYVRRTRTGRAPRRRAARRVRRAVARAPDEAPPASMTTPRGT